MTRRRGYTLIELVVTLSLIAIFGGIAYPMLQVTMRGIQRNTAYARQFETGRDVLGALGEQVRMIAPLPGAGQPRLLGEDGGAGPAARDHLQLTGCDLSNLANGTHFTIDYYVVGADVPNDQPAYLAKRYTAPDGTQREIVAGEQVAGFDAQYWDGEAWRDAWTADALPEALRLTVYVVRQTGTRPRAMFTEVNLPAAGVDFTAAAVAPGGPGAKLFELLEGAREALQSAAERLKEAVDERDAALRDARRAAEDAAREPATGDRMRAGDARIRGGL